VLKFERLIHYVLKGLLFVFFFSPVVLVAQQAIVKGVVKDDKGQVLPQAHLAIFPDSIFTVTNSEGRFIIHATRGEKQLKVSYLGFEIFRRVMTLTSDTVWTISLKSQANEYARTYTGRHQCNTCIGRRS
jgi:iron complex outermembrane recepter protein